MNTKVSKRNSIARAVANYIRKAGRRRNADLAAPTIPDWWLGDLEFAGLVPRAQQEEDMEVMINIWPGYSTYTDEYDMLYFEWCLESTEDWKVFQEETVIGGQDPGVFPIRISLTRDIFKDEGRFLLRYRVQTYLGITNTSLTARFIIDKTPPNDNMSPNPLAFVDAIVGTDGITDDYLQANGGLKVTIPPYSDTKNGDRIWVYAYTAEEEAVNPVYDAELTGNPVTIRSDAFNALTDGKIDFKYRLFDKAGNKGPESDLTETSLLIKPLPTGLDKPVVPLASDGLLDLEDIRSILPPALRALSIPVHIKRYDDWQSKDTVILTWGGAQPISHLLGPIPGDPIVIQVPYSFIEADYGNDTGVKPTTVSYVVQRGNRMFPAPSETINVNLFVPGPVNPDRPDPINKQLPPVTVKGGSGTSPDNVLTADDIGLDAAVSVKLYDPIGPGERMKLYWNSTDKSVARHLPTPGSENTDYVFTVPWADIEAHPSAVPLPVFYTVDLESGEGNKEMCEPTLVDVSAAVTVQLAEPEFPDAGSTLPGDPILNCSSFIGPDQEVAVFIPGNSPHLKGGETLSFTWQCYDKRDGLPGDEAGPPQTWDRMVTSTEVVDGFEFNVGPFAVYILPVDKSGSVRLTYVSDTTPPLSGEAFIRAAAWDAAGICPINTREAEHQMQFGARRTCR
ncbi:hypothetical protein SAMN03159444_04287 [Pseudomonas sp. NFACC02]|uniref:hypothetical protein n=1 Tax=Pseudomonas sp. NFACC02 TaxID=1566250 RepID=UPI0008D6C714|nr:hypothetical protein [Pseudomonas sp. NFACC02]SER48951.1 hypothetical protein SAMN03159444_04287 [Pseudomonas sp. NFACC02]